MYFKTFPTIPYDSAGTGNLKEVTNFTKWTLGIKI